MIPATVIPASVGAGPLAGTVPVPIPPPGCHSANPADMPGTQRAPGPLRNGNPRGNPHLAPRCGAKARTTGCPCRAPAMANGRCRMHGGNCRGPSSPEGRARIIKANTKHGRFAAPKRADQRYIRTLIVRTYVLAAARRLRPYLPPEMAARLAAGPRELAAPIHPSNLPFLASQDAMPCTVRTSPTAGAPRSPRRRQPGPPAPAGRAAERLAARAELAALAPWRQAIAFARAARRAARQARAAARQARAARRKTQSARRNAVRSEPGTCPGGEPGASPGGRNAARAPGLPGAGAGPAPAPLSNWAELSLLERELAARAAGLRAGRCAPPPADAASAPGEKSASPGPDAVHSEPPPAPPLARLTPTKAAALRGTSLSTAWDSGMRPALAARFGTPAPEPGWCIPQAMPPTGPAAAVARSLIAAQQRPATPATPEPATGRPCPRAPVPGVDPVGRLSGW